MRKLKRGDKHPKKNLIFYQYHHPFYKETNGEVWLSKKEFDEKIKSHNNSTRKFRLNNPLKFLVVNTLQRNKKYSSVNNLIDLKFIEYLWKKQKGKCFWFKIPMTLQTEGNRNQRNPLKVTIDRLDNKKGYSKNNVVLCSYVANCGRGNATIKDWKKIIKIIKRHLN